MSPASSTAHAEHRRAPRRAWAARAIESAMHIRVSKIALGWFLAALAIRFLAMLLIHGYSLSAGFGGFYPLASGHDDRGYFHAASQVAANGYSTGDIPNVYPIVLGWWLSITGVEVVWGKMLNVLAGSGAILAGVMLTQDLAREQWPGEDGATARRRGGPLVRRAADVLPFGYLVLDADGQGSDFGSAWPVGAASAGHLRAPPAFVAGAFVAADLLRRLRLPLVRRHRARHEPDALRRALPPNLAHPWNRGSGGRAVLARQRLLRLEPDSALAAFEPARKLP
jgi:hypothetical protein